jgi:hypothetical protein
MPILGAGDCRLVQKSRRLSFLADNLRGVALLLGLIVWQAEAQKSAPVETATSVYGFRQFSDNTTVPVEKKSDNIAAWYATYSESISVKLV